MDFVAPADRRLVADNMEKYGSGEAAGGCFRCRLLRKDGVMRHVDVFACRSLYNGRPAALGTMTDITEQLLAQRVHADQFQFLQKLIDSIPAPIFYKSRKGVYRGCNKAFAVSLGLSREEIVGKTIYDFHPKELADKYHEKDEELYANPGIQIYETSRRFPDGTIHHVVYHKATYTDAEGNIEGLIGIILDITDRKRMESLLEKMSITDELTGLYNRRGFFLLAQQQFKIAERTREAMILVFVDLDGMKWINDSFGHQEGDKVLVEAAAVLQKTFRKSDIIGRIGGDEFAALAVHFQGAPEFILINRLRQTLDVHAVTEDRPYKLSLSAGIAHYDPQKPRSLDELMAEADERMYREKEGKQRD
jgi:diguanylate cyclase (GGDEF)-like protein/PAS domain S-box-containing protein